MAVLHKTTLTPGKLDLLKVWLPGQPWYLDPADEPRLTRAGGFRLDDPNGEVGIEFMVITDARAGGLSHYLVPMTYRSTPLADDQSGLLGTAEHGVLGMRWVYDGIRDPVLIAQIVALIQGDAEPQAQSVSDTPDPTVNALPVADGSVLAISSAVTADGPPGTQLVIDTASIDGTRQGHLTLRVLRNLRPGGELGQAADGGQACLSATWRLPDQTQVRGILATGRYAPRSQRSSSDRPLDSVPD